MTQPRPTWNQQLVACYERGMLARQNGEPRTANPYTKGYSNRGGNLQKQRSSYWLQGWDRFDDGDSECPRSS